MRGRFRRPELLLSGGCIREAVRYEVSTMPLLVFACHCTWASTPSVLAAGYAQRRSASAGAAVRSS